MAYTPVITAAGQDITDALWNTYVRDNFAAGVPDIFTTKGDLAVASGNDAAGRLAVGTDYQVLQARAGATLGVEYSGGLYCHMYLAAQTINDNTTTKMQGLSTVSDPAAMWDNGSQWIALPAGFPNRLYQVTAQGYWTATGTTATYRHLEIRKNAAIIARQSHVGDTLTQAIGVCCSVPVLATAGDYFEVYVNQRSGGNLNFNEFYFTVAMIR